MVLNVGALRDGDSAAVFADIKALADAVNQHSKVLKVILETGLLTRTQIIDACVCFVLFVFVLYFVFLFVCFFFYFSTSRLFSMLSLIHLTLCSDSLQHCGRSVREDLHGLRAARRQRR